MSETHSGPTKAELVLADAWFAVDAVTKDPATTAWKRSARLQQSRWRERHGWPIGAHPYSGGDRTTKVGSRLALEFAKESGSNFLTPAALEAAKHRLAHREPHQTLLESRLWADLLSSMPLCFNLFGDLQRDPVRARAAVHAWWPALPVGEVQVRFEHSPARRDMAYLGNQSAFDASFEVTAEDGSRAFVGIETKYHEHAIAEGMPTDKALRRYVEVTERSNAFVAGWREQILGTPLQQIWLDHLLVLSMLQHPARTWAQGLFVLVYPSRNPSFAAAAQRYAELLSDASTFHAFTLEDLVSTRDAIAPATTKLLRKRYL